MAGILIDLSDDIKKLQSLKEEIANVKNELSSINVNVKIDIAQGLEQRLQSLMGEYNALGRKIAENDAKITISAQNIIKTAESITQAQEKLSGAANAVSSGSKTNGYNSNANIAGQAKLYDDLKERIEVVTGGREDLVRRMVEEMNEIRLLNAEIKNINKAQSENGKLTKGQKEKLVQLNSELLTHKTALSEVRIALNNTAKLDNAVPTSMNALSQSLSKMREAYRELSEEERNSPFGKDMLISIQQADAKIKELDASIGNHQRNVGNYMSAFAGFKDIKDADVLTEKFKEANIAIEETEKSIRNLSQASSEYASKGKDLRDEITTSTAILRQGVLQGGLPADEQMQEIENLKSKIQEYGAVMVQSSAAAQAAYDLQKENIVSLETELANLQTALQNALSEGNTATGDVIAQQILKVNTELKTAQLELDNLSSVAEKARISLTMVADEQVKMSQNVNFDNSFIGNVIDLTKIAKTELKDFLKPATDAVSSFTETAKEKINAAGQTISDVFSNLSNKIGLDRLGETFSNIGNGISEYTSKIINAATGNGKFQQSLSSFKEGLNQLPIPLGNSINGIVTMTKSLWAMAATPIGAVLTGIVLALQALFQWFTKSAEGQRVYAQLTAYLGSLLSSLTDIVVTIGKYLYHAFADAGAPMNSFAKSLKTTFVSAVKTVGELVKGLGLTLRGIFDADWDTFKKGISTMGKGVIDAGKTVASAVETTIKGFTGIVKLTHNALTDDKLANDISKHWNDALPKARESAALAVREANARVAAQEAQEKAAKLDNEIAKKREDIYKLTGKAKDAAIEEVKALMKAKYDDQIKVQKEQLDILKTKNNLHTSSLEDLAKERDLNIQLLRTQAQREASTRMMTRMQQGNLNKMATSAKNATRKSNAINSADTKWDEILRKNANERIKVELEIQDQVTEARIKAMQDGAEKVKAERDRQNEKELEQIKKQRDAVIEAERNRQKAEFDAEQAVVKAHGGKTEQWDESMLDETFINKIKEQYDKIYNDVRKSQQQELYKAELQSMRDYLKEYGSFQQQKLAIAEEYDEKIAQAGDNEWEKKSLEKQREADLRKIEIDALKQEIDWKGLLGDFGNLLQDQIQPTLDKLRTYSSSEEFKSANINDQQIIYDLISQLEAKVSDGWSGMFRNLGDVVQKVKNAEIEKEAALKKSIAADEEYAKAVKKNTVLGKNGNYIDDKNGEVKAAQQKAIEAANELTDAQTNLSNAQNEMGNAATRVRENLNNLTNGLQQLGSGSMSGILGGADSIAKIFGENDLKGEIAKGLSKTVGGAFGEALGGPMGGEIVEGVFALLDLFKDGIENLFTSLIDTILGAVNGLLSTALSLDVQIAIGKSLKEGLGNILNTITFGGFDSWFGIGGNAKEVADEINRLTSRNEELQKSIDNLSDIMKDATGAMAISTAVQAEEYQRQKNKNLMGIVQANMAYSHAHHSWGYNWNGFTAEQDEWIRKNVKADWKGGDEKELVTLTPEEMKKLLSNQELRDAIYAPDYGGRVLESLDAYAAEAGKIKEITDALKEALTQISFDSLRDSLVDSLMDMDKSAQDFADDFSEYMMRAVLNARVDEMLGDELQAFYDKWAEYSTDKSGENYELTEDEINKLQKDWDNIVQRGVDLRDQVAAITGYGSKKTTEQSATAKGIESITADQADQLIGRVTAIQIGVENGNAMREQEVSAVNILNANLAQLVAANEEQTNKFDGIADILAQSYLVQQDIRDNTGISAKALKVMQSDLADIKNKIKSL